MNPTGDPPLPILRFDRGTLVLARAARDRPPPPIDGPHAWLWDPRSFEWRIAAAAYRAARTALAAAWGDGRGDGRHDGSSHGFIDRVRSTQRVTWSTCRLPTLRPEQNAAIEAWRSAGGRGVIVMPTGTGKTEVALTAMYRMTRPTLVVAPIRALMYQWFHRIRRALGVYVGLFGDGHKRLAPVTVTTYDSAYRHMARFGDRFELLVFDEAHHLPGASRRDAALLSAAPYRMGLTATPERADGLHGDLADLVGPIVYRLGVPQVRGRTLAEYQIQRIDVTLTDAEERQYQHAVQLIRSVMVPRREMDATYSWRDLCNDSRRDARSRRALNAYHEKRLIEERAVRKLEVVEDVLCLHAGEPVLIFAGSNLMAMDVARRFLIPAILAHTGRDERRAVLAAFAQDKFPALVSNRVLDEGIDVPSAKVAIVIGGLASTRQATQRLGRVLRLAGTRNAILYEVVCTGTRDERRSRSRRNCDAYRGSVNRGVWEWSSPARPALSATA